MDQSTINVRYSKAFFETAKEKKLMDTFKDDIELVSSVCKSSKDFNLLLESPVVKSSKKKELVKAIFSGKVHELTLNFLQLIIENKRENHIPGICLTFLDMVRTNQNIKSAVITTATEIEPAILEKVRLLLEKELDARIELSSTVKPDIIGGIVLRIDDKQYDASIASQLRKIKQKLLESELR